LLIEGCLHAHLDEGKSEAAACLEQAISCGDSAKDERHIPAFASYELAFLLLQNGAGAAENVHKAKLLLIQARDKYKNYDFDNRLGLRIHAALRRAEAGEKK